MKNTLQVAASGEREIVMTRTFNAPRQLVFEAWTTPALLQRWLLGPPGWSLPVCEIDFRVGGRYRYVWKHQDGREMGMGGEYLEIVAPEKIVNSELFDQDWTGGKAIGTLRLVEHDGKTTITHTMLYSSSAARDGALQSGMATGVEHCYALLDECLADITAGAMR